jgi:hypothetical protein
MDTLLGTQDANELIIVDGILRVIDFTLGMITLPKNSKIC